MIRDPPQGICNTHEVSLLYGKNKMSGGAETIHSSNGKSNLDL